MRRVASPCVGGEGEGLAAAIEPLTFILSLCLWGEAIASNIVGLRK